MANKKFSEFTLKTDSANVDFVVGYDGSDNVRITPNNLRVAGGADTQIQFNNSGALGGGSFLTTNKSNKLDVTNELGLKGDGGSNQGLLKLYCEAGTAHHVGIKGPAHSGGSSYTLQLPNTLPNVANQVLESNAAGTLSWIATPSGAGGVTSIVAGSGITVNQATGAVTVSASGGGGGASSLNGLSDVLIDGTSNYFVNIPAGLSGNPADNLIIGSNTGTDLTTGTENILIGKDAGENLLAGTENTMVGVDAGTALTNGSRNTFFGNSAGFFTGNSISDVIAIGYKAGTYAAGSTAIAIGREAGRNNSGNGSIDVGYQAGYSNSSGSENTNIGYKAGYSNTSSGSNTKVGYECAYHNTGQQTAALGYRALYGSSGASSGSYNTAMGRESGVAVTSGSQNTLIGAAAGKVITTGGNNTVIGSFAGFNTVATGSNNILIGQNSASSSSSVSNEVNLFNGSVVARFQGSASAWSFVSDARDKKDIEDLNLGLDFISKLKPRKFKWNLRDSEVDKNKEASGFVAQEVKEVLDEMSLNYTGIVDTNNPNQYTISQANIIPMLVKAIQELKLELDNSKNCK